MKTKPIIMIICAAIIGMIIGYTVEVWIMSQRTQDGDNSGDIGGGDQIFCTQDAKMCPDGSYVGRVGPNCEFAPCPGAATEGAAENI